MLVQLVLFSQKLLFLWLVGLLTPQLKLQNVFKEFYNFIITIEKQFSSANFTRTIYLMGATLATKLIVTVKFSNIFREWASLLLFSVALVVIRFSGRDWPTGKCLFWSVTPGRTQQNRRLCRTWYLKICSLINIIQIICFIFVFFNVQPCAFIIGVFVKSLYKFEGI